jgi:predicted O-methyltransferase YrrM
MGIEALTNWAFCEDFVPEDDVILAAREIADELGCVPVLPGAGTVLRFLARIIDAHAIAEVGTGAGVSTVYLARGMNPAGVITSIDIEPEHHRVARETLQSARIPAERVRLITGAALAILPRLTDGGYDMVLIDATKSEYPAYVDHALRMLRVGGVLAIDNSLWHSKVPDPAQRDHNTTAIRETLKTIRGMDNLTIALVPSGDGLLLAVKGLAT